MGRSDITVHGFRSSFRDWCGDTGKPADIAEAALAHTLGNQTQVASVATCSTAVAIVGQAPRLAWSNADRL